MQGDFRLAVSRQSIRPCLVVSAFLFQHVAPKKENEKKRKHSEKLLRFPHKHSQNNRWYSKLSIGFAKRLKNQIQLLRRVPVQNCNRCYRRRRLIILFTPEDNSGNQCVCVCPELDSSAHVWECVCACRWVGGCHFLASIFSWVCIRLCVYYWHWRQHWK